MGNYDTASWLVSQIITLDVKTVYRKDIYNIDMKLSGSLGNLLLCSLAITQQRKAIYGTTEPERERIYPLPANPHYPANVTWHLFLGKYIGINKISKCKEV